MFIGFALALDAFGVSLGLGCGNRLVLKQKIAIIFSFGFFQFFLAWLGAEIGFFVSNNFFKISNQFSGIIILFIGLFLLKEGYEKEESCTYVSFSLLTYIIMGVSVSIDALGVGFSLLFKLSEIKIFLNSLVVGLITSLLTMISFILVHYIKSFKTVEKYADYIGGIILVIFGLNMII